MNIRHETTRNIIQILEKEADFDQLTRSQSLKKVIEMEKTESVSPIQRLHKTNVRTIS